LACAPVPAIVDFIHDNSIDFVIVTAEHNALDIADFMPLRYALAATGIACLARTHSRDADDVSKLSLERAHHDAVYVA
jgi:hypothetical protein